MADSPRFTLHLTGVSYYAQKVCLALFEKNEPFSEKPVDMAQYENCQPDFMRINPAGKIPILEDRGKYIAESDNIIDYLDSELPQAPRLVPDTSTDLGRDVAKFRAMLDVNIPILTFGTAYHPDLIPGGKAEKTKAELDEAMEKKIAKVEQLAAENPDLREVYQDKISVLRNLHEGRRKKEVVQGVLDDFHTTMDVVEDRIVKSGEGTTGESWLLGSDFTAADISLIVWLRRLSQFGLAPLYFTDTKRPAVYRYWQRLQTFPSFCKLREMSVRYGLKP